MPYFVKIGHIPENKSGVGSRGYHLFRSAKRVTTRWGGVVVLSRRRFQWAYEPRENVIVFRTQNAARAFVVGKQHELQSRKGYDRLPVGKSIAGP